MPAEVLRLFKCCPTTNKFFFSMKTVFHRPCVSFCPISVSVCPIGVCVCLCVPYVCLSVPCVSALLQFYNFYTSHPQRASKRPPEVAYMRVLEIFLVSLSHVYLFINKVTLIMRHFLSIFLKCPNK